MGRELGPGRNIDLSALRNAGVSTDSVGYQTDENEIFEEEEEFEELGEAAYAEEQLAADD